MEKKQKQAPVFDELSHVLKLGKAWGTLSSLNEIEAVVVVYSQSDETLESVCKRFDIPISQVRNAVREYAGSDDIIAEKRHRIRTYWLEARRMNEERLRERLLDLALGRLSPKDKSEIFALTSYLRLYDADAKTSMQKLTNESGGPIQIQLVTVDALK